MNVAGNGGVVLHGTVYAPSIEVDLSGNGTTPVVSAVFAGTLVVTGNGGAAIGTPPPTLPTITGPATLPNGLVNAAYPATQFTATGGVGVYVWTATGLPAGLTMNPSTGIISGTPAAAGTATVRVGVTDALGVYVCPRYLHRPSPQYP